MKTPNVHTDTGWRLTIGSGFAYFHSALSIVRTITSIMLFTFIASGNLRAQSGGTSATQSVTIEVKPISKITVTGNPGPLLINDAIPGSNLSSVTDDNTKYSVTTNLDNMKIVASINNMMPAGTKLLVKLSSTKAASAGYVDVSSALEPVDVVTGISRESDANQSISYTFAANADVSSIPTQSRTITLTLSN